MYTETVDSYIECVYKCAFSVMPDWIRHPEGLESVGFRVEFIPMKIGAGMTTFINL
jgi:hypothetical protein